MAGRKDSCPCDVLRGLTKGMYPHIELCPYWCYQVINTSIEMTASETPVAARHWAGPKPYGQALGEVQTGTRSLQLKPPSHRNDWDVTTDYGFKRAAGELLRNEDQRQPSALSYTPLTSVGLPGVNWEQNLVACIQRAQWKPPRMLSSKAVVWHTTSFCWKSSLPIQVTEKKQLVQRKHEEVFLRERKGDRAAVGLVCCTPPGRTQQLHRRAPVPSCCMAAGLSKT